MRHLLAGLVCICGMAGAWAGAGRTPDAWTDCLAAGERLGWAGSSGGLARGGGGVLELGDGEKASVVLARPDTADYDLDIELHWQAAVGRKDGGVALTAGPHAFGSAGYRVVVSREPWRVAETRLARLEVGQWHTVELRVRRGALGYWLDGRPLAQCGAAEGARGAVRLVAFGGARARVRRCRIRVVVGSDESRLRAGRFVYPAVALGRRGRVVADGRACGGRALELAGQGAGEWLVGGQDATLGRGGRYEAVFGLRSAVEAGGDVWLEVRRSGGEHVAGRTVRLEELPARGYARVGVAFRYEPSWVMEYRVAASGGRLRIDQVAVAEAAEAEADGAMGEARRRPRRALALRDVWGKAPQPAGGDSGPELVRVDRRLCHGGWYEFRAVWHHAESKPLDELAVDLWVASRAQSGLVRVFDRAAAYDAVGAGRYETKGWMSPHQVRDYGPPVALFAQLYWRGKPIGALWRKWGIPVEDKYIVAAPRRGGLAAEPATE